MPRGRQTKKSGAAAKKAVASHSAKKKASTRTHKVVGKIVKHTATHHAKHLKQAHTNALNPDAGPVALYNYKEIALLAAEKQHKEGACEPDHLGRPRVRSLKSRRCVLADSKTMRSQGQCVPRVRTLKSGRQVLVHSIANPLYGKFRVGANGKKIGGEPFCIKAGGAKAKKIAEAKKNPALACSHEQMAVEKMHKVPVWTGGYKNNGKKEYKTVSKKSVRCIKPQGDHKQCPIGKALYEVRVPSRTGKVFAKGSGLKGGPLKYATKSIPAHSKFICSKEAPKKKVEVNGIAKMVINKNATKISNGVLAPKLYIPAKIRVSANGAPAVHIHHHAIHPRDAKRTRKPAAKKPAAKKPAASGPRRSARHAK